MDRKHELEAELARILPTLVAEYQPEAVYLYGSLATGHITSWSDIDLAIVKVTEESFYDRLATVLRLIKPRVGMDVCVYTPQEWLILCRDRRFVREEILHKGKLLYAA